MRCIPKLVVILAFLLISVNKNCLAFDDGDLQFWHTESISMKLNEVWKIKLEEEFYLGDDCRNPYYQHSDIGVTYSGLAKWLDIGLNYRHVYEERSGDWKVENRPHLNANIKWKLYDFGFSNRSRFEYRNREDAENFWRYRNLFSVKLPYKFTKIEIQPYISDEVFYDFDQSTLNENRLTGGFAFPLAKYLNAQIYHIWQSKKTDKKWNDTYVLGIKLGLDF